jgi:predicted lactoylglutathione lyase
MKAVEAAGATHWMGEPSGGSKFYEVKYHDPDGIAFDITANGWAGAGRSAAKSSLKPPPR